MDTPFFSIAMYLIASVLGALGQFFYKWGAERASGSPLAYITNFWIIAGVFCYIGVMVLFVVAMKRGGSLAVLYPVYASTFIWAAILSAAYYGTPIRGVNILGMMLLVGGMYLMGK